MIDKTGEEAAQGFANRGMDLSFGLLLFGGTAACGGGIGRNDIYAIGKFLAEGAVKGAAFHCQASERPNLRVRDTPRTADISDGVKEYIKGDCLSLGRIYRLRRMRVYAGGLR